MGVAALKQCWLKLFSLEFYLFERVRILVLILFFIHTGKERNDGLLSGRLPKATLCCSGIKKPLTDNRKPAYAGFLDMRSGRSRHVDFQLRAEPPCELVDLLGRPGIVQHFFRENDARQLRRTRRLVHDGEGKEVDVGSMYRCTGTCIEQRGEKLPVW